jgi:hypothetical protein
LAVVVLALSAALAACLVLPFSAGAAGAALVDTEEPEVVIATQDAVGDYLVCYPGSWEGERVTFTYEWRRGGASIAGAKEGTYRIQEADQGESISCVVTARDGAGEGAAESVNAIIVPRAGVLEQAPVFTTPARVVGEAKLEGILGCREGDWEAAPTPTFAYEWLREGQPISGAGKRYYLITAADEGADLSCEVTATNSAGSSWAVSENSVKVPGTRPKPTGNGSGEEDRLEKAETNLVRAAEEEAGKRKAAEEAEGRARASAAERALRSEILGALESGLLPAGKGAKLGALLGSRGLSISFRAPTAGKLVVSWSEVPDARGVPGRTSTAALVVATGSVSFSALEVKKVRIELTSAGKRVLGRAGRIKLLARASFTPTGEAPVVSARTFELNR